MRHPHTNQRPCRVDLSGPDQAWGRHGGFDDHQEQFGPRGGHGPHGRRGGGRRGGHQGGRPRGDVRAAILALLAEQPRHGYDLIRAIEERSGGSWTPSPGSIYPTLQALEDQGLLTIDTVDGRRTASLTDEGLGWAEEHAEEYATLFDADEDVDTMGAIRTEMMALREAAMHVARHRDRLDVGTRAVAILVTARKELYRLLADDDA